MKAPLEAYYRHMLQKGYSKCTLKSVESVLGLYGSSVKNYGHFRIGVL